MRATAGRARAQMTNVDDGSQPDRPSTRSGTAWSIVQYGAGRSVTFLSTLVLARLLAPDDFGLVALAMLAINVFDRVKDLGVGPALVQQPGEWRSLARTGAILTTGSATVVAGLCAYFAPSISQAIATGRDADALEPLLRALAVSLFITGLGVFPDAALCRFLRFKDRVIPELFATSGRASVSIGLAFAGFGAWSLVLGQLVSSVILTSGYWFVYRRRRWSPVEARLRGDAARSMLRFGASLSGVALLSLILDNFDYFVIGRRLGAEQLGYYTIAFRVPEMIILGICVAIGKVLFSAFSRVQRDRKELRRQYLLATREVTTVTVPLGLGISAVAEPLVRVLFGSKYEPSVPLVVLLGVYAALYSMSFHTGEVYKAIGRADIMIKIALTQLLVFGPTLWLAAGHSLIAVASTLVAGHALYFFVRMAVIRRVLSVPTTEQIRAVAPAVLAGIGMALIVTAASRAGRGLAPSLQLALLITLGVAIYVALLRFISPDTLSTHPVFKAVVRLHRALAVYRRCP